jgi:hypothetical protein
MSRVVDGVKTHVGRYVRGWKRLFGAIDPDMVRFMLYMCGVLVLTGWPYPVGWVVGEMVGIEPALVAAGATAVWFLLVLQPYFSGLEE